MIIGRRADGSPQTGSHHFVHLLCSFDTCPHFMTCFRKFKQPYGSVDTPSDCRPARKPAQRAFFAWRCAPNVAHLGVWSEGGGAVSRSLKHAHFARKIVRQFSVGKHFTSRYLSPLHFHLLQIDFLIILEFMKRRTAPIHPKRENSDNTTQSSPPKRREERQPLHLTLLQFELI